MQGLLPQPELAGAVDGHEDAVGQVVRRRRGDGLVAGDQEGEVARDGLGVGVGEHDVLAGGAQRPREPQHRPDGVAVGVVVGRDQEPLARAAEDVRHVGPGGVPSGGDPAHAGSPPRRSSVTSSISFVSRAASCWVES